MSLFLDFLIAQISIYFGIPLLIAGLLGGCLNVIVFLSLRTFRRNSCAFYLVTMSSVDCGQLFTGLLSRIMISGFDIDWTTTSAFYCKFRYFIFQTCALISLTCLCLATMDQYLATCSRPRWQRWSDLKTAYRLMIIFSILWSLHGILYAVFIVLYRSISTNAWMCGIVDRSFVNYHTYCYLLILTGTLPILFTAFFGLLAYRNVRQLNYRSIPLVRQELEKQLTVMVLVQVIPNVFTLLPYTIINVLALNPVWRTNATFLTNLQFARDLSIFLYYANFAVSTRKKVQWIHSSHLGHSSVLSTSTSVCQSGSADNWPTFSSIFICSDGDGQEYSSIKSYRSEVPQQWITHECLCVSGSFPALSTIE